MRGLPLVAQLSRIALVFFKDAANAASRPLLGLLLCAAGSGCGPIEYIANARIPCMGPHPKNLILLCCDAFGVLPPVAKLTKEQAM